MKEDIHTIYTRLMKKKYEVKKPPNGLLAMCQNCVHVEIHQWYTGEIKDPLTCKCLISGEYDLARHPAGRCSTYNYNEKWELRLKYPKEHQTFHYQKDLQ